MPPRSLLPFYGAIGTLLALVAVGLMAHDPNTPPAVGEREATAIAIDAYTYGYPLVMMEMTRRVMTNVATPEAFLAPMGQFAHQRQLPSLRDVPLMRGAPNPDLLFSTAWVDVSKEPCIITLPDFKKRFYLINIVDAWSSVVGSPGQRTLGNRPPRIAITGPDWKGQLPQGIKEYRCTTGYAWIIGQIYANPRDLREVATLQNQMQLTTLSQEENPYLPPPGPGTVDPNIDMTTPVRDQVSALPPEVFFKMLSVLLIQNPPICEAPLLQELEKIGFLVGEEFDLDALEQNGDIDPTAAKAFRAAPKQALEDIRGFFGKTSNLDNGWTTSTRTGVYLGNYLQRATIAFYGLGANRAEDTLFPQTQFDAAGEALSGQNRYRLHFPKGKFPPVQGFWSLTLYGEDTALAPNSPGRSSLTSRDSMRLNSDGSFDLLIQHAPPAMTSNWLPAPAGPFTLVFRLYNPKTPAIEGSWTLPPLAKEGAATR